MGLVHLVVLSRFLERAPVRWIAAWRRPYPSDCIHHTLTRKFAALHEQLLPARDEQARLIYPHDLHLESTNHNIGISADTLELESQNTYDNLLSS